MKIFLVTISICGLTGCANLQHAIETSAALSCSDNLGRPIPAELQTRQNCFRMPPIEQNRIGLADFNTQSVITPQGTFRINQIGNSIGIVRTSGKGR